MTENRTSYRGVKYRVVSSNTIIIDRQLVNGIKIPEVKVNVKVTGRLINNATAAYQIAIDNIIETRNRNGISISTNSGTFFNNAYDNSTSGNINFTDIGRRDISLPFKKYHPDFFKYDFDPKTFGQFRAGGVNGNGVATDWVYNLALLWQICNLGDSLFVRSVIHRELAYGGWRWLVIGGMILRLG